MVGSRVRPARGDGGGTGKSKHTAVAAHAVESLRCPVGVAQEDIEGSRDATERAHAASIKSGWRHVHRECDRNICGMVAAESDCGDAVLRVTAASPTVTISVCMHAVDNACIGGGARRGHFVAAPERASANAVVLMSRRYSEHAVPSARVGIAKEMPKREGSTLQLEIDDH
ncbi:hypothetical protein A0H81_10908 [Grifola frondosa]|uniref:Uncharacterized protein n=1 Tax=Grifola frondosa TaxID=5627 RepID=A0A1C7LXV1_GRIFR|nr:hypothetical protein A0H81_10908 [Grifola frondosa]